VTCYLTTVGGCAWDQWHLFTPTPAPPPPDSYVLGANGLQPDKRLTLSQGEKDLAGAHEVFRHGDYSKAEDIYRGIADNTKNTAQVGEEARFYEAECMRLQGRYPKACDTYHKVLIDFPSGVYRDQAMQHMFDIADGWLNDTREEMDEVREKRDGKRWVVWPHFVQFDKTKPFLDEEGRALEALQQVRYSDMTGPLADKALFLCGSVHFFNEDYKEADQDFTQLVEMHPTSPLVEKAIELGIIAKHLSTGGSDYDGRKVAEARQLVQTALNKYPELRAKKSDFLTRQLVGITYQQAEKDFKIAEFYRRTGHPGSAYFCYEIVRRRYPGTKFFDLATERMHELKAEQEKKQGPVPDPEVQAPGRLEKLPPGEPLQQHLDTLPLPRELPPPQVPGIPVKPPSAAPPNPVPLGPSSSSMQLPPG
jgi:outer membrane protein assembly factor BamD (BamD/ComL family)